MDLQTVISVDEYLRTSYSPEIHDDVIATESPRVELTREEIFQD